MVFLFHRVAYGIKNTPIRDLFRSLIVNRRQCLNVFSSPSKNINHFPGDGNIVFYPGARSPRFQTLFQKMAPAPNSQRKSNRIIELDEYILRRSSRI